MTETKAKKTSPPFGILAATKALTNPIKGIWDLQTQQVEILKSIEEHLAQNADYQRALATQLTRVAVALERQNGLTA